MTLDTIFDSDTHIQKAQRAVIARMEAAPENAKSTLRTCGVVEDGLACRVTQGKFEALLDLGLAMGGTATGPSPGFFGRAAIAGCVAIAVKMLAAREGVAFSRVDVAVEMDFDDAALFGVGHGNAAPLATRVAVDIETDADERAVQNLVSRALEMDPWFLALRDPQNVTSSVNVTPAS